MNQHAKFEYFLETYWNRTAEFFFKSVDEAFADYISNLNEIEVGILRDDIIRLRNEAVFPSAYRGGEPKHPYWSSFDRIVLEADVDRLLNLV